MAVKKQGVQAKQRKQAVVIVHGMGEQKPLDTRCRRECGWNLKLA